MTSDVRSLFISLSCIFIQFWRNRNGPLLAVSPIFFSRVGLDRVLCSQVTKNPKNRIEKKRSVCNHSPLVCVLQREMYSWPDAGTFMTWEHTRKNLAHFFSLTFVWFSSPTMMLQSKNGKAIIPYKKKRKRKKSIYCMIIGNSEPFFARQSVHSTSRLPIIDGKSTRDSVHYSSLPYTNEGRRQLRCRYTLQRCITIYQQDVGFCLSRDQRVGLYLTLWMFQLPLSLFSHAPLLSRIIYELYVHQSCFSIESRSVGQRQIMNTRP